MTRLQKNPVDPVAALDELTMSIGDVRAEIAKIFFGQDDVVEQVLVTLLAGGHGLLVGVPGLGKTLLVETLAKVLGLGEQRVQFTPDLMPADILGSEVLDEGDDGKRHFRFIEGPVFCQLLMADEINRASPRTQSALLQAMQEGRVSIAGQNRPLPKPFHVLATQNPIEQEGTYPLPEAQLDRFLLHINIDYPTLEVERQIMLGTTDGNETQLKQIWQNDDLSIAQSLVRQVPVGEDLAQAVLRLVRSARPVTNISGISNPLALKALMWGPGPRAAQAMMLAIKARAVVQGRLSPSLDDVRALALPVLRHRMAMGFAARAEGITVEDVVTSMLEQIM
jgi:MoxR-like ATPase